MTDPRVDSLGRHELLTVTVLFCLLALLAGGGGEEEPPSAEKPENTQAETIPLLTAEEALAKLEVPAGFEAPLFAGDTLHVEVEVIEARLSKSRPGRGLVRTRNKVVKSDGTVALIYTPLRMIKCRDEGLQG